MKLTPFECPVCGKPRGAGHPKCSEIMRQRALAREKERKVCGALASDECCELPKQKCPSR